MAELLITNWIVSKLKNHYTQMLFVRQSLMGCQHLILTFEQIDHIIYDISRQFLISKHSINHVL